MRIRILAGAALAVAMLGVPAAQAASPAYTTANVNFRTGPDTEFPSLGVIPEGDDIYVEGCLRDESWCDVRWDGDRGWVYSEYIAFDYRGDTVLLPDLGLSVFGIPIVGFSADRYWDRYYVGRPWYKERNRWYSYKWHPRKNWRGPPKGKRTPGWWRSGYSAPKGMKAPPGKGWKRPAKHGHGHDRGDDHRKGDVRRGGDDRRGGGDHRGDKDHRDRDRH